MNVPPEILSQCWFLAGPTAVGKTETSLLLAERIDAEILSLDSMAIYRQMDIGTAKPTTAEQQRVPHHLIDIIDPDEVFSTAEYVRLATQVASEIVSRGRSPLFVGGTGLYLRSILRGVFEGPDADWEYRLQLEAEEEDNPGCLHEKLKDCDPILAEKLHPNDLRRVIRALEVYHQTGIPLSAQQQQAARVPEETSGNVFWLHPERDWLYERINRRVDLMFEQGLVEEVRGLLERDPPPSRTALQGLGYKEMVEHLNGEMTLEEAREMIKVRTRQFAKRQHTWFRNLPECQEIKVTGNQSPLDLVDEIIVHSKP
ncbi:tRNA (adenosine(37)-N6)-dimethylallyltransferase MiaA [Rubinisphaera sp.]|uniref:tRNA (adenosine(37)-N6)-dimethylallyltransferase MiaA n=1 Tax=Rubinisphaera sp. TaxID=2024857 RepID=UPI000C116813|nr:tRNA (adenosine(37)-N6)-dimethylallyltransferase MiaA [Rubinisphaera sp.]MBV12254.1 tRNA (adenosine(37)-N6)-dimethylallyltransferase MiaA [Rubinisphaera sp.]|tara:strand:+ start:6859 stop:7800 length:942 start_codon:yes stop_codon:yes gene_type:complete